MKIVLVVSAFPKLSESFIVNKFLGLLAKGWDVHIVCQHSEPKEWNNFPELQHVSLRQRVHVTWSTQRRWLVPLIIPLLGVQTSWRNPTGVWRYWQQGLQKAKCQSVKRFYIDATLIALKPDLIHFEFGTLAVNRMYLRHWLNCPITLSFRGYDLNYVGLDQENYYDKIWQEADGIHFLGQDLWYRAQRRGCPPTKQHMLIPPAIDTNFFTPEYSNQASPVVVGTPERPLRILSLGRLEWKKGYEYALQAVRLLQDWGVHYEYRIIGEGKYLESVAFARHQLGLTKNVQFLKAQPRKRIRTEMEWADVFLHTAVSEGFSNAVLEAQAMQLPVVTSDADGLSENVANGETGFVVPRRHPHALAEKLQFLANHPRLRQQLGQRGRQRILTHFQLEDQIEAFSKFYSQFLENKLNQSLITSST